MRKLCDYYFVCTSPWTYLGHERLLAMARKHDIEIRAKPINLGQIFSVSGGLPLAKRAAQRQAYRLVELERWRKQCGLPLNIHPKFFPADDRLAARSVIAAAQSLGSEAALAVAGRMLKAVWADDLNIADESTVLMLLQSLDFKAEDILTQANTEAVQKHYEANTEEAMQAGVFGAPWYIFEGVPYWGQDRLDFLEAAFTASGR